MVGRLKALEDGAAPLIAFLQNPNAVQELRADKQYNLQMLNERYQVELPLNCKLHDNLYFQKVAASSNMLTFIGRIQGQLNEN